MVGRFHGMLYLFAKHSRSVKSILPNTEKWLRKRYDENDDNNMSNETKRETNYSMNNKWNNNTRNMHITWAWTQSAHSCTRVHIVSYSHGSRSESCHFISIVIHERTSLSRFSSSISLSLLLFHLLHCELYSELDNLIAMESLCYSAKGSDDAYDVSVSLTRSLVWWGDSIRKAFKRNIQMANNTFLSNDWISSVFTERSDENSSIWQESLTWIVPRIRSVRGWNLEGWRTGCRHWGVGNDGRIGNLLEKTQCERGDISQRNMRIYFSNRRWTNQNPWKRSGTEGVHLDTGPPNSRRRSRWFSLRTGRVSTSTTSRLTSGCRWSDKWFLVHVRKLHVPPSRWTKSQTSLAERRIIPYSTEIHWRLQNNSYKFGCWARTPHRWLLEHRWIKRFVWFLDRFHSVYSVRRETSRPIYVVRVRDWQESSWHPGQIINGENSGRNWEEMPSWGEA